LDERQNDAASLSAVRATCRDDAAIFALEGEHDLASSKELRDLLANVPAIVARAGSLSGVPQGNIVAYADANPSTPAGAAWDRGDVQGGGRLAVAMDINWFAEQCRGSNWEDQAENIVRFLGRP
jgi:hypothetical protein